jgi:hypothetical protein
MSVKKINRPVIAKKIVYNLPIFEVRIMSPPSVVMVIITK